MAAAAATRDVDVEALPASRPCLPSARRGRAPEGAEGRQGPSRVPADLLGAARPDARHAGERVRRQRARGVGSLRRLVLVPGPERSRDRLRPGARSPRPARGGRRQGRRPQGQARSARRSRGGSNAGAAAAPGSGRQYDSMAYLRDGSNREPEAWVYRDREGRPFKFTGAELSVGFDAECRYAGGRGHPRRRPAPRRRSVPHAPRHRVREGSRRPPRAPRRERCVGRREPRRARPSRGASHRLRAGGGAEADHARAEGRSVRRRPRLGAGRRGGRGRRPAAPLARRRGEGRERQGRREHRARGDGRGPGGRLARRIVGPRASARQVLGERRGVDARREGRGVDDRGRGARLRRIGARCEPARPLSRRAARRRRASRTPATRSPRSRWAGRCCSRGTATSSRRRTRSSSWRRCTAARRTPPPARPRSSRASPS